MASVGIAAMLAAVLLVGSPKQVAAVACPSGRTMYPIQSQVQSYTVFDLDQGIHTTVRFYIWEYSDNGYNAGCRQIQVLDQITDYNVHVGWSPAMTIDLQYEFFPASKYWVYNAWQYRQPATHWYQQGFASSPYYVDPNSIDPNGSVIGITAHTTDTSTEIDDWCGEGTESPDYDGTSNSYDYYTGLSPICNNSGNLTVTESH